MEKLKAEGKTKRIEKKENWEEKIFKENLEKPDRKKNRMLKWKEMENEVKRVKRVVKEKKNEN